MSWINDVILPVFFMIKSTAVSVIERVLRALREVTDPVYQPGMQRHKSQVPPMTSTSPILGHEPSLLPKVASVVYYLILNKKKNNKT